MKKFTPALYCIIILLITTFALASPVPDTGQTKCYDDIGNVITCPSPGQRFFGQDANYTINPMSYTKLDANGNALPDSATSWTMVKDNVTGLIWEVKTNYDGIINYNDPHDADNKYTWYDSNPATNGGNPGTPGNGTDTEDFIKALNDAHFGGFSDWRLPTIEELDSIVNLDIQYPGPTINTAYFFSTVVPSSYYWSSTTYVGHTYYAWCVHFSGGADISLSKDYDGGYVRAVRGGQSKSVFKDNGNGTITDTSTGLMWQQNTPDDAMIWEQALSYCENLSLGGHTDWRLPTRKELKSLVDYSRYNPAINTASFPNTFALYYWSSTNCTYFTYFAWSMDFNYGYDHSNYKDYDYCYVRAVRGGQSVISGNSLIAMQPMSGPPGTTFVEWGTGFTPYSTATLHFLKPDGTEYPTLQQPIDAIGHFEINYTAPLNKPSGTYVWWGIDGVTHAKSNEVSYVVTSSQTNLDVQTINPQSNSSFYANFYPSPHSDQLITGGTSSSTIAADGVSRLLLRIISNNPGQVTINESQNNTQQNGSLSNLDNYLNASASSSVSVQLQFDSASGKYIGFAVYKAPMDFTISGDENKLNENKLTRPITLNVTSSVGNSSIPLKLRRPPIFISHGLWSSPKKANILEFIDMLWSKYSHSEGVRDDYLYYNDCELENASYVSVGTVKTRSNIRSYLSTLRQHGMTVTQVDYLGHSMGGLWGRLLEQMFGSDLLTYKKGYLHKLITLDTPHDGSIIANLGQPILDGSVYINLYSTYFGLYNLNDFLCEKSKLLSHPLCDGAIPDLTSSGCEKNLKNISVPSHAITSNFVTQGACDLVNLSKLISGATAKNIGSLYKLIDEIMRVINPNSGCENWVKNFGIPIQSDVIVGLNSQEGGLNDAQFKNLNTHWHMNSFDSDVNDWFFKLLNYGVNDSVFATGFPASTAVYNSQQQLNMQMTPQQRALLSASSTPLGDIQFIKPVNGSKVQPGDQVNVQLALTGTLTLSSVLILAPGSDAVELVNSPYTAAFTVPNDAYDTFAISALGAGTDGNLYAASVTLSVNSSAVLQQVNVSPQSLYMDLTQELSISVTGTYSDGTIRNLSSSAQGTTYKSSDENILSVSSDGTVIPHAVGVGYVLVSPASSNPVTVRVEIAAATLVSQLDITPPSCTVASSSGTATFTVSNTGSGTMPWTAQVTSGTDWLSITSGGIGTNSGSIKCSFDANSKTSSRTGTIRVTATGSVGSPKDVTIIQSGVAISEFMGVWSDGVWTWNASTKQWTKMASTSNALMIAAGDVDGDKQDDLIGVWASGLYVHQSSNGQWLKLSTSLPTWITAGDLNNDGKDDVIGSWKNDGVYWRDSATGKWAKLSSPAKELATGNVHGDNRDDLVGVWNDGLWARYSATGSWQKFDSAIPTWITAGDMTGSGRSDIIGSYTSGTWYRNSATGAWTKITTPAEQLAAGDIDGDGRDDLIGVWSNGVWVRYGASGKWAQISSSKPKWITTGRISEAIQAAGELDDPINAGDVIDMSQDGPGSAIEQGNIQ